MIFLNKLVKEHISVKNYVLQFPERKILVKEAVTNLSLFLYFTFFSIHSEYNDLFL